MRRTQIPTWNVSLSAEAWEDMWAPYDETTYSAVLDALSADDVVLDIGAGDCRLTKRMAQKVRRVYAIERNRLLGTTTIDLPANCKLLVTDARRVEFAPDIDIAVLLMRHCTSFALYWEKLKRTRCQRLITNARWGMGVEIIDMSERRVSFKQVSLGWYACSCGETGFVAGEPERITAQMIDDIWEVRDCPACIGESL
jgi:hypothetical protein